MTEEMRTAEDAVLLERYAQGDPEAFEAFFLRHRVRVYHYVLRKVQHSEVALELTQDVFLKLHAKIQFYQPGSPALNWFFSIVHNTCVDFIRKRSSHDKVNRYTLSEQNRYSAFVLPSEQKGDHDKIRSEQLLNAISSLPVEQRKVVEGRALDDRSFASLAHEIGKSEPALRKVYSRALKKLSDLLGANSGSGEGK